MQTTTPPAPGLFDDLLDLRTGDEGMRAGGGPTQVVKLGTVEQWEQKAAALRELYQWTLGDKPEGYDQPLDLRTESEGQDNGLTRRELSYVVGPDERIRATMLIPPGRGPHATVVTIHPTSPLGRLQSLGVPMANGDTRCAYGLHLARRGYITLSYDLLGSHERNFPGCRSFDNQPFIQRYPNWSGRGKDLYDLARAIDALETMPEVDRTRLGVMGHSQGGGMSTDAMAVEPRLAAAVNNCGDWPFRLSKNPFNRCRNTWWTGQPRLAPFALCGKTMPIDLHEKLALAAPRPVLNIVALDDFGYSPEEAAGVAPAWQALRDAVRSVYALYGMAERYQQHTHVRGHAFDEPARELAYAFLDAHLRPKARG